MAYPGTFIDIQNDVIDKLRLDPTLDRDKVKDWINASYMEACMETEFYQDSFATSKLPANTGSTGVPAPLDRGMVDYVCSQQADGSNYGPMDQVGLDVILNQRVYGGATPSQGAPQMYAYISGPQPTIEFWPSAGGGEVLTFYGVRLPPFLVADGDVWTIPEPYGSNILEFGADAQAAEFKMNYVMLSTYQQESMYWLTRFRAYLNNRGGDQVQQLQIVHSRTQVPASNSVDVPANW